MPLTKNGRHESANEPWTRFAADLSSTLSKACSTLGALIAVSFLLVASVANCQETPDESAISIPESDEETAEQGARTEPDREPDPPADSGYRETEASNESDATELDRQSQTPELQQSYKDGRPNGIRVTRIPPGSFLSAIGIREGDVIISVNGNDVTTPQHVSMLYG